MVIILLKFLLKKDRLLFHLHPDLFEKSETTEKEKFLAEVPVKFNHEEIREKLDKFFESKEWVEQSLRCLGCGACAYVCPTCACFDIQDEAHGKKGSARKMLGFMWIFTFYPSYIRT